MTLLFLFFFVFVSVSAHAGFVDLPQRELYQVESRQEARKGRRQKNRRKTRTKRKVRDDRALRELLEQDKKILELLEASSQGLIIKRSVEKINALARVRGTLLNSVVAMNTAPTTFIVRIDERESIKGAELKCQGQSFGKRVISKCSLMVAEEKEYSVNVEIWDLDGAQGMIADYLYSGEEKSFLASSLASFLQGSLEATKTQVMTPLGEVTEKNARNQILNGLGSIAGNAKDKIAQSGDETLSIAYVNAGKSVLVFFHQSLELNQEAHK